MSKSYYYLVASLPELALDDTKLSFSSNDFRTEIYPNLSKPDQELIDIHFLQYDNKNVLELLSNADAELDKTGKYTIDELVDFINMIKNGDEIDPKIFPSYLSKFISDYFNHTMPEDVLLEDRLTGSYYEYAKGCKNEFISKWYEFNFTINNILVALIVRKYKWDSLDNILGHSEISDALRTSGARDFGISNDVDFFDSVLKISEITDLVEREKKLDLLRWDWLEDNSFFCYFTIEKLFVFLLQIDMIERWISLDKEMGNTIFRNIINSLKEEVQIPAEFR